MNGLVYVLNTGCQWRAVPKDMPPRSTLHDYFDRWNWDGTLDAIHDALYAIARQLAAGIRADYANALPSALVCFEDDFEGLHRAPAPAGHASSLRKDDEPPRMAVRQGKAAAENHSQWLRREAGAQAHVRRADPSRRTMARPALHRVQTPTDRRCQEVPANPSLAFAKGGLNSKRHAIAPAADARSNGSKTGVTSAPDMTAALAHTSRQSALPPPSSVERR